MNSIINNITMGTVALTVLFLLMSTIVLPHFNTTYNTEVTGLSSTTLNGLFLLVLVLALIGMAIPFISQIREK